MTPAELALDQVFQWLALLTTWLGLLVGGGVVFSIVRAIMTWWGSR